jgi:hypothetical protein
MAAEIVIRKVRSMAKSASRKKKGTARGKPKKGTSPPSLQHRNQETQPKAQQRVPATTTAQRKSSPPEEKEKEQEKEVEKPFIVRTPVNLVYAIGNAIVGAVLLFLWSRSVAQTHGFEGTVKVASVSFLRIRTDLRRRLGRRGRRLNPPH